jgi:isoleucyl-tRNA synthetase
VDFNGCFTAEVTEFVGAHVKAADGPICDHLKAAGRLVNKAKYLHSYPFCWRSDTPLIYKAVPSWFVAVESIKDRLLANNAGTYWVPNFVKEGQSRESFTHKHEPPSSCHSLSSAFSFASDNLMS